MCWVMPPASPRGDVRVADRVEQAGLAVVDVTHDGDDRRTGLEVLVVLALELGLEVDVEGVEQLALLLLRGDDLDVVAELGAEQPEGVLVERLGRRGHLTEVEQHGDQRRRVGVDLVGEVGQRGAAAHPDDGRAVTAGDPDAAERRRLHLLELLALRALGLAPADRTAATAAEGTLRAAATAGRHRRDRRRHRDDRRSRRRHRRPPGPPGRHRDRTGTAAGATAAADAAPGRPTPARSGIMPGLGRAPPGRGPAAPAPPGPAGSAGTRRGRLTAGAACPGSGRTGCCPDAGRPPGAGRPMPWLGANGLLPGRGCARTGRRTRGAGPGAPDGRGRVAGGDARARRDAAPRSGRARAPERRGRAGARGPRRRAAGATGAGRGWPRSGRAAEPGRRGRRRGRLRAGRGRAARRRAGGLGGGGRRAWRRPWVAAAVAVAAAQLRPANGSR